MNAALLPILEPREVAAFLQRVPLAVDRGQFDDFVLGFPHKYLSTTPAGEVLKHFMLMQALRDKAVISSLSSEGVLGRLCIVARDRSALFSRIAGALSSFEVDIVGAEAFANAAAFVLDTFSFVDSRGRLADDRERRQFQVLLEEVVEGRTDLGGILAPRLAPALKALRDLTLEVTFDAVVHPDATAVTVCGPDHFGLLYLMSRAFADGGYNIEMAYVETPEGRVRDQFFLTREGSKLTPPMEDDVRRRLARLEDR
jgi:UTP:GlnB (protein PII) uridylyltransferase